jgi:hypothetical protein
LPMQLFLQGPDIQALRTDSAGTEHQAAQVALLVLRTTVEGAATTRKFFVLPSRAPLSLEQAARALSVLQKPVRCTGDMEDAALAIACEPLSEAEARENYRQSTGLIAALRADVDARCPGSTGEHDLLVRRKGTSMTVPFRTLGAFLRDYEMAFSLGGVRRTAELPEGVCMIFEVGPPGTMKIIERPKGPVRS